METKIRASTLIVAVALVLAALPGCSKKPADNAVSSTDTVQSTAAQTTGTTATETGGGTPVTTTTATTTTKTSTKE